MLAPLLLSAAAALAQTCALTSSTVNCQTDGGTAALGPSCGTTSIGGSSVYLGNSSSTVYVGGALQGIASVWEPSGSISVSAPGTITVITTYAAAVNGEGPSASQPTISSGIVTINQDGLYSLSATLYTASTVSYCILKIYKEAGATDLVISGSRSTGGPCYASAAGSLFLQNGDQIYAAVISDSTSYSFSNTRLTAVLISA